MVWFVVHTRPRAEKRAAAHLRNQGFVTYLPCCRKRRSHARRVEMVRAPLFPRYLFVQADSENCRWQAVCSTVGVIDIVRQGLLPAALPRGVVEAIHAREDRDGLVSIAGDQFLRGEALQVADGPLRGHTAFFEYATGEERVIVLLHLLGRNVRVSLPVQDVARAA